MTRALFALGLLLWPALAGANTGAGRAPLSSLFDLVVSTAGQGGVSRDPQLPTYPQGTRVVLVAVAIANWHFAGWSGDTATARDSLVLVMNSDRTVTATFEINPWSLEVEIAGAGTGSVGRHPLQDLYADHSSVVMTALPVQGSHFASWSGDATGITNPLTVVMDRSRRITATFVPDTPGYAVPDGFSVQTIAEGLDQPVGMAFVPDGRLLVIERESAKIRMLVDGSLSAQDPVCVVDSVNTEGGERGLLGIAVDPAWPARPFVYVAYTALGNTIRLSRYTATGRLSDGGSDSLWIDPASRYDVLREIEDLLEYHNGGGLHFGPDSLLYYTIGDDGDDCAAQDSTRFKGVMLRLDVRSLPAGPGGPPPRELLAPPDNPFIASDNVNTRLIWAFGLRNPFSFHIDPANGSVFIGDVGLSTYEEVDHLTAATPVRDMGWPYLEGPGTTVPPCPAAPPGSTFEPPVYAYYRGGEPGAIISAGVIRSSGCPICDFPAQYTGDYFFSDFYLGFLRRLKFSDGAWALAPAEPGQPGASDWGRGFSEIADYVAAADGGIWFCRTSTDFQPVSGAIGRLVHTHEFLDAGGAVSRALTFAPPYPSPAREQVHFVYTSTARARVELVIFDVAGRRVRALLGGIAQAAGSHHVAWDARSDAGARVLPGVYLARLTVDGRSLTRRVLIAR